MVTSKLKSPHSQAAFMHWRGNRQEQFAALLRRELPLSQLLEKYPVPAMMMIVPATSTVNPQHRRQLLFSASWRGRLLTTGSPLYVHPDQRCNEAGQRRRRQASLFMRIRARRVNEISVDNLHKPMRVNVKIRRRHEPAPALIERLGEYEVVVTFDKLRRDITQAKPRSSMTAKLLSAASGSDETACGVTIGMAESRTRP